MAKPTITETINLTPPADNDAGVVDTCLCGCGEPRSPKRQFRPGHDAKLKSQLLQEFRSGGTATRLQATATAERFGWGKFMTQPTPRARKSRARTAPATKPAENARQIRVGRWTYPVIEVLGVDGNKVRALVPEKKGNGTREVSGTWV